MSTTLPSEKQSEAIKKRMAEIRSDLPYAADDARIRLGQLTDWKYHAGKHSAPILTAAAVMGYLLIPNRKSPPQVVVESDSPRQDSPCQDIATPAKKSFLSGMFRVVATMAMKQAVAVATRQATHLVTRHSTS